MRKSIVLLAVLTFAMAWAAPAAAHWAQGDPYKMHYPQLPDASPTGWDVLSSGKCADSLCRVADDFRCTETGWVKDIHFWGSWKGNMVGQISHFRLEVFKDVPGLPFSKPGQRLWWYDAPISDIHIETLSAPAEGWWDPCGGVTLPNNHQAYYQYNVTIPQARWFCQEYGQIYWLGVYACVADTATKWGWKTSRLADHFMDDGVYGWSNHSWTGPLIDPVIQPDTTRDLAFVITGDAVPPQKVPSLTEWGVIILALLIAGAGVVAVLRRRATVRAC
jgi:hypothetical protein